jgi:hypothetical protein
VEAEEVEDAKEVEEEGSRELRREWKALSRRAFCRGSSRDLQGSRLIIW